MLSMRNNTLMETISKNLSARPLVAIIKMLTCHANDMPSMCILRVSSSGESLSLLKYYASGGKLVGCDTKIFP
tara:strand:- start:1447 stop:1665 length:219 start_codon:yes stop_codon:yes gene_type:complete